MLFVKRASIFSLLLLGLLALVAVAVFIWSGTYNIGADDAHTPPVYALLQTMRNRSVASRANQIHPPPTLKDAALIRQGAGNYAAMCTGCHLAPGMAPTELSRGLYPAPPALARATGGNPSHHFWVIKHGVKASGMPAWGGSMDDEYIWGLVAFLQVLPTLTPAQYQAMVDSSGGHAHGGGETMPHGRPAGHAASAGADVRATPGTIEHRHADGTVESHPAPPAAKADDGHDHEH
jgi:mono/diheme cytochrome c family protein